MHTSYALSTLPCRKLQQIIMNYIKTILQSGCYYARKQLQFFKCMFVFISQITLSENETRLDLLQPSWKLVHKILGMIHLVLAQNFLTPLPSL